MENNAPCKIVGVGTVKIKMFDSTIRTLADVGHVPELKQNLISLSILDSKGHKYTDEGRVFKASPSALHILQGSTVIGDGAISTSSFTDEEIAKL